MQRIRLAMRSQAGYSNFRMSLAQIEAELEKLSPDELRHLALKSWRAFVEKEGRLQTANECNEDDPGLLAALDEAISKADATPQQGYSGEEILARLRGWNSK